MSRRRHAGRAVNGILVFDKPAGLTSNQTLQQVKRLYGAAKAGHTGSLDPLATGILPICFGDATKFTQFLLDADKTYQSTFRFGVTTNTSDSEGEVIAESSAAALTAAQVEAALAGFRGPISQVPSMFSALKHQGQPLYKLARQGIEIERAARAAIIHDFRLLAFRPGERAEADVAIRCSKGTYVRTLAADLGAALGCGGHVIALRRTVAGPFGETDAVTLAQLEDRQRETGSGVALDAWLKPVDTAVADLVAVNVPTATAWYFQRGQAVMVAQIYHCATQGDIVRVFASDGPFLGVAEVLDDGRIAPRRLLAGG